MNNLLISKGYLRRQNTMSQSHDDVLFRAKSNLACEYFFDLHYSNCSQIIPSLPHGVKPKAKEILLSNIKAGDIIAAKWKHPDNSNINNFYLAEVINSGKETSKLVVAFFSNGEHINYAYDDDETGKLFKATELNTGGLI